MFSENFIKFCRQSLKLCTFKVGQTKFELSNRLLCTRSNFSKSVMVSVGISSLGCTELIFIDPGVKINGAYYRDVLLGEPPIALISMWSSTRYGTSFKNVFIKPTYAMLTISNSDLWRNEIALIKELLIVQSMNGEIALEHLFELMAGILNISFEEQHLTQINFSCFCQIVKFNIKK